MKFSLRKKVILAVLIAAAILTAGTVFVSYRVYSGTMDAHYEKLALNLASTASELIDKEAAKTLTNMVMEGYRSQTVNGQAPDFDSFSDTDWIEYYEAIGAVMATPEYETLFHFLSAIKEENDVKWMYLCFMDKETGKAVYIVDADVEGEANPCGYCDNIEERNMELIRQGIYDFPAYITNYPEYGWLCSAASAIVDENGEVIADAYVDISMNKVVEERHNFLIQLLLVTLAAALVVAVFLVIAVDRTMVKPINLLAEATGKFISEKQEGTGNSAISQIDIHTRDEIEHLSDSIKGMEKEINTYITDLTEVTAERERIGAELDVATNIQASMLPCIFPAFPDRTEFDIHASMDPAKEVGGDFYDFFMVDDRHLAVVVADVSGKGIPAALFMVIGKTLIKDHTQLRKDPGEVFVEVNDLLCESNSEGLFITAFEGVLDLVTGEFRFVNAGHEIPFICKKGGDFEPHKIRAGFVLAGMEGTKYQCGSMQLDEGDKLFQYTDGVPEATDSGMNLYGMERLGKVLNSCKDESPKMILKKVKEDIDLFVGEAPQFDDITMLCVEFKKKMEA